MQIRKAKEEDITAVAALYDAVCDTLEAGENYPGWAKGDYPTRRDAEMGEAAGELFVTEEAGEILGTMMLREEQERNPRSAPWQLPLEEQEQLTIYTFAVRPDCRGGGGGRGPSGICGSVGKGPGQAGPAAGCARDQYPGDKAVRELRVPIYCYRGPGLWGIRAEMV